MAACANVRVRSILASNCSRSPLPLSRCRDTPVFHAGQPKPHHFAPRRRAARSPGSAEFEVVVLSVHLPTSPTSHARIGRNAEPTATPDNAFAPTFKAPALSVEAPSCWPPWESPTHFHALPSMSREPCDSVSLFVAYGGGSGWVVNPTAGRGKVSARVMAVTACPPGSSHPSDGASSRPVAHQ
jgi:hypothetical protein